MKTVSEKIRNYIQLHTSEMENSEYIDTLEGLIEWANSQIDIVRYRDENNMGETDFD